MKPLRIFLLLAFLAGSSCIFSQSIPYQYAYWTETFTPLSNPTVLSDAVWDDVESIQIGFPFKLGGKTFQAFEVSAYEGSLFDNYNQDNGDTLQAIFGYNVEAGLADKPGTQLAYKLEGTAPNRIFKIEWLKTGFEGTNGEVSFQFWLHEAGSIIQIKLGPQNVPDPAGTFYNNHSPIIGLGLNTVFDFNGSATLGYAHWLKGPVQAPGDTIIYNQLITSVPLDGCDGIPVEGAVFTFTPGNVTPVSSPLAAETLQFFPNPATDEIYFSKAFPAESGIQILDLQGRVLFSGVLPAGTTNFRLPAGLQTGVYLIRRNTEGTLATGKMVVH